MPDRPTKEELKAKLGTLIDAADYFDANVTRIAGTDENGIPFLALFALGKEAQAINRLIERRAARCAKKEAAHEG